MTIAEAHSIVNNCTIESIKRKLMREGLDPDSKGVISRYIARKTGKRIGLDFKVFNLHVIQYNPKIEFINNKPLKMLLSKEVKQAIVI